MEGCGPCERAYEALQDVLTDNPKLTAHVATLWKENHSALVAAYELKQYPTVLILDEKGEEITRRLGSQNLSRAWWKAALDWITNQEDYE